MEIKGVANAVIFQLILDDFLPHLRLVIMTASVGDSVDIFCTLTASVHCVALNAFPLHVLYFHQIDMCIVYSTQVFSYLLYPHYTCQSAVSCNLYSFGLKRLFYHSFPFVSPAMYNIGVLWLFLHTSSDCIIHTVFSQMSFLIYN